MRCRLLCAASQFYCLTLKLCLSTGGPWNTISSYNNSRDCSSPNLLKIETSSYYRFLPEYLVTEAGTQSPLVSALQHCSTAAGSKLRKLRLSAKQQDVTFPVQARVCRGMGDMSTPIKRLRKLNEINNTDMLWVNFKLN